MGGMLGCGEYLERRDAGVEIYREAACAFGAESQGAFCVVFGVAVGDVDQIHDPGVGIWM